MNVVFVMDFVYGDPDSSVLVQLLDPTGTPIDLTGATNLTLTCRSFAGDETFTITAASAYGAPTNGQILFASLAMAPAQPPRGRVIYYRAIANWKPSGASAPSWAKTEFRFSVEAYP